MITATSPLKPLSIVAGLLGILNGVLRLLPDVGLICISYPIGPAILNPTPHNTVLNGAIE